MKEINCELAYSDDLWVKLDAQMNEFGQISIEGCDDALVELMPVVQKNFINEIQPVIEMVLNFGSQIALGLLVNWLYDMMKEKKIIVINGRTIQVNSEADISRAIEDSSDE